MGSDSTRQADLRPRPPEPSAGSLPRVHVTEERGRSQAPGVGVGARMQCVELHGVAPSKVGSVLESHPCPLMGEKVLFQSGGVTKPKPKEGVRCVRSGVWNLSKICNFPPAFPQRN